MPRPTTGAAYLTLILTILGGVIFMVFLMIPSYSTWRAEQLQFEASTARYREKQTFLENIDARTAELRALDRDVRALQILFPETIASAELTAVLHGLASRNGVAITQVTQPGIRKGPREQAAAPPEVTPPTVSAAKRSETGSPESAATTTPQPSVRSESAPYEFGVFIRGSYAQVRAFMVDLERSLRFFELQTIALSGDRGEQDVRGPISAQLNIWTYLTVEP